MEKATIKFNGGRLALLCSKCAVIIKTGKNFTVEEMLFAQGKTIIPKQYCDKCKLNNTNKQE